MPHTVRISLLASLNEDYELLVTAIETWSDDRIVPSVVKGILLEEWRKKVEIDKLGEAVPFQGAVSQA